MTEEEKRMVMQFMGQTYGEVKKQDSMLVNQSGNLSPKSEEMKEVFTQMARQPTQPAPHAVLSKRLLSKRLHSNQYRR